MDAPLEVRVAPRTWVPVQTLYEASVAVRQHIDAYGLGYSAWGQGRALVRETGTHQLVAIISYNARVWTTERDWQKRIEITGEALHRKGAAHA